MSNINPMCDSNTPLPSRQMVKFTSILLVQGVISFFAVFVGRMKTTFVFRRDNTSNARKIGR